MWWERGEWMGVRVWGGVEAEWVVCLDIVHASDLC